MIRRIPRRKLLAALLVGLASCVPLARPPSRVRDTSGRPLPTTARVDADTAGAELHCTDGSSWLIVEPPPPFLAGTHLTTSRVVITNAPRLCAQIRATDY